jgi:TDG/mug DNA glycosylase family protein
MSSPVNEDLKPTLIYSFDPVVNVESKVMILGTLPGTKSLSMHKYYAQRGNRFWSTIDSLFNSITRVMNYENRIGFLLEKRIGLWDVLASGKRIGSSDKDITDPKANDFNGLLENYPGISHLMFNGERAYILFISLIKPKLKSQNLQRITIHHPLPSTSSRNRHFTKQGWMVLYESLEKESAPTCV